MPKVKVSKNQIHVGKKKVSLVSGEVHYWRLNPNYWKEILTRVKEMGLDTVATYVPWDYHEYERGKFDFTGKTDQTRNLKAFLDLTRKMGFWVIIRPGPYIYSEWPNEGAPAYAYKYHRLHPKFIEYSRNYVRRVCKVIKPYLASKGSGHIIMLQADNEIDPWPDIFGQQYGLSGKPGIFQEFMKSLYHHDITALNQAWGTRYEKFEEVGPFIATMLNDEIGLPLKGDKELKRNIDYFKFKYFYSKKVAVNAVKQFRDEGVDVPIYLNVYPFFYAHDWQDLQEVSDLIGIDLYPSSEFAEDEFEQRKLIDKIRFLKSTSAIPYIAEFESGVWHQRHYETGVFTPNHYRLLALSALLGGIKGWNWYMLVNRDNWYMSPINEWGRVRGELYDLFRQVVGIFRRLDPPTLEKITDVAVTFNPLQYAARTMTHNSPVLVALYNSDVDYELVDPRTGICNKKFLFYSGNQWLETESQKNLRKYVEAGGTLIAFRDFPRKDDKFHPVSSAGFEDPKSILFEFRKQVDIQLAPGRRKVRVVSSVYTFGDVKGQKIMADLPPYGRFPIGYIKKIGKGRIVHIGVEPTDELVLELLDYLKADLITRSQTRDVKTALFKRGKKYYMVVTNNGDEDKSASVWMPEIDRQRGRMIVHDVTGDKKEPCYHGRKVPFTLNISRKDGKVFEITPTKKKS